MLLKTRAGTIVFCLLAFAARPSIGDAIHASAPAPATEDIRSLPLLDQHGKTTTLSAFEGRTLVVHFIFTHCVVACHTQVKSLKTVRAALTPETRARVQFLSVSLDPERDTPETLREYARTMGVDNDPDWHFATASPDRIARMTEFFAVKREKLADGQFDHTLVVFLLDPSGSPVQRYASPTVDTERLTREISSVVGMYDPARQAISPTRQKR
jgi:protein SCO1